jgi:hypothetical protein
MIVDRSESGELLYTQRIKRTRCRFPKPGAPLPEGFFQSTQAHPSGSITCEGTIAAVENSGNQIAFLIRVGNTLLPHLLDCTRQHVAFHLWEDFFNLSNLPLRYRRARITLYTACTQAFIKVTTKKAFGKVKGHQGILNLKHSIQISNRDDKQV